MSFHLFPFKKRKWDRKNKNQSGKKGGISCLRMHSPGGKEKGKEHFGEGRVIVNKEEGKRKRALLLILTEREREKGTRHTSSPKKKNSNGRPSLEKKGEEKRGGKELQEIGYGMCGRKKKALDSSEKK